MLYAKQLQRRLDAEGVPITVLSLHPGAVDTGGLLLRYSCDSTLTTLRRHAEGVRKDPGVTLPVLGAFFRLLIGRFFLTASDGAYASSFAAASPIVKAERDKYKGAYLDPPGKIVPAPAPEVESTELAEELWATTETILKSFDL